MGLGRRNFVKLMSLALTGLTVDPLQAVITNKNAYVNKKMGIIFQKPTDWRFVHVKKFAI